MAIPHTTYAYVNDVPIMFVRFDGYDLPREPVPPKAYLRERWRFGDWLRWRFG